jgi:hypothetical protein
MGIGQKVTPLPPLNNAIFLQLLILMIVIVLPSLRPKALLTCAAGS